MKIEVIEDTPKLLRLALSGMYDPVIDAGFGSKLMAITGVEGQDVIVDISKVPILLSFLIGTLLNAVNLASRKGTKFILLNPQPAVASSIESLRLTNLFGMATDGVITQSMESEAPPNASGQG